MPSCFPRFVTGSLCARLFYLSRDHTHSLESGAAEKSGSAPSTKLKAVFSPHVLLLIARKATFQPICFQFIPLQGVILHGQHCCVTPAQLLISLWLKSLWGEQKAGLLHHYSLVWLFIPIGSLFRLVTGKLSLESFGCDAALTEQMGFRNSSKYLFIIFNW